MSGINERTLRSLRSAAVMPDQSSRMKALAARVALQQRRTAGRSIAFPDNGSYITYTQGPVYIQKLQPLAPLPPTVPDAPTGVVATPGDRQASVAFQPPARDGFSSILDYTVYAFPGGATATGAASPIDVSGLQNGLEYIFTVKARNAVGFSSPSAASAPVIPLGLPEPPTNISAYSSGASVVVTFSAPTNTGGLPITKYTVNVYLSSNNTLVQTVEGPATLFIISSSSLIVGSEHYVKIVATTSKGSSVESAASTAFIPVTTPSAPTNLVEQNKTSSSVDIAFTAGSDGGSAITNYQYSTNNGFTYTSLSPTDTTSPIAISGLAAATAYSIKIRAINAVGVGAESTTLSITTLSDAFPAAPTLTYALADDGAAYIYFDQPAVSGVSITNYEYSLNGSGYIALDPADTISPIKISGLTNESNYNITLRAISGAEVSADSNTISATPTAAVSRTAELYYDISAGAGSYDGTSTTVSNIGSAGVVSGQLNGAITYNAGVRGGVFDFNGGRISFPQTDFGSIFTVSAWVNPTSKASINALIANIGANQQPKGFKLGWNSWNTTNRVMLYEGGNGTIGNARGSAAPEIEFGVWQHLTYILDTDENRVFFFKNGIPVNISNTSIVNDVGTNQTFTIGAFTDGSYSMDALFSSIKIHKQLLSAADILAEFNETKTRFVPPAPTNLTIDIFSSNEAGTIFNATISFTEPSDPATYAITNYKYSIDDGNNYIERTPAGITSPIEIPSLSAGITYNVKLRAVNSVGDGLESDTLTITTPT
jgi:hypothetical protein